MIKAVKQTILTIDDERSIRLSLMAYLEDRGFNVIQAENGRVGLQMFNKHKPDLVLVDLRMPEVDGLDVLATIQKESPDTPLIVVSGTGTIADVVEAMRLGAWDYLLKPITNMEILAQAVEKALKRARLLRENKDYQHNLEHEVESRTKDLLKTNQSLEAANARQKDIVNSMREIVSCSSIEEMGTCLLKSFANNLSVEGGSLYINRGNHLELVLALDPGHAPSSISLPLPENSIFDKTMTLAHPFLIENVKEETNIKPSGWDGYKNGSVFLIPLHAAENEVGGLIALHSKQSPPFTDQDREKGLIMASFCHETLRAIHATEGLRASEENFRQITENIREVFWIGSPSAQEVYYISPAYESVWGRSAEDLYRNPLEWFTAVHEEDRPSLLESIKKRETTLDFDTPIPEYRIVRPDGTIRWIFARAFPIRDGSDKPYRVVGIAEDITARKDAEEERSNLESQVQHAQKLESLGVLAGGIAHDFNNLLMAILGNADLALSELPTNSPAKPNLVEIEKASHRAADLCKQMLAYSGKGKFVIELINLSELVEEMAHILEVSISKKAILRFNFATTIPVIEADATQIRQIIMNLITNASDAIGDRSGVISIKTGQMNCDTAYLRDSCINEPFTEGEYTYIEVSDNGSGMSKETISKLFDPFFTTKFLGRGLGMSAVLGIVRGHKGTLKVYSEMGKGTSFKVLFPACTKNLEKHKKSPANIAPVWQGNGTVLVVDDEEAVCTLACRMLNKLGFSVLSAKDGRQGMEMYRNNTDKIDCVLLDLTMPHMDGEEAFCEIRRINKNARVILSSGYNEMEITERFVGKGLAGFIQKPYQFATLREKIKEVLA